MSGRKRPAGEEPRTPPSPGHIECCICTSIIPANQYATARVWSDPHGVSCCAHAICLIRVGEKEIGLR